MFFIKWQNNEDKNSRVLRCSAAPCSAARGSRTGFSLVGPTKVKACKSFLFTESSLKVENKEDLVDFVITLCLFL